jgi:hypothetical protein
MPFWRPVAPELSASLVGFIHRCIPTLQAAEVLLFFAARPEQDFTAEEIVVAMRPNVVTVPAVKEYAASFVIASLISEHDGRFRYRPATFDAEQAIGALSHAYNERPVTLITEIYKIADSKLQSFSDSFKLRGDKS